jgi:hypothetical protein
VRAVVTRVAVSILVTHPPDQLGPDSYRLLRCAGQLLSFAWHLDANYYDPEAAMHNVDTEPAEDHDPYGLVALEATWVPPAIGVARATVDLNGLCTGKYVVVLAPKVDVYTFIVEGQPLWLGRVSSHLKFQ